MPTKQKKDPRDKEGVIVHALSKWAVVEHTARNIFGNVDYYNKTFMEGTVVNVFDGHATRAKNASWRLMVDFCMPSDEQRPGIKSKRVEILFQHCLLGPVPAGKNPLCRTTFTDFIGDPDCAVKGSRTYLHNTKGRANAAAATAATMEDEGNGATNDNDDCVSHDNDKDAPNTITNAIIVPPAAKTATKTKRKRRKTAQAAVQDDTLAAPPPPPPPPPSRLKSRRTAKPVNLRATPLYSVTTDTTRHCIVAIAHERRWVNGNAETIMGDVASKPSSNRPWSQTGPIGEKIGPGNPDFEDMSVLEAFLRMMPPEQLALVLQLINKRLAAKEKKIMLRLKVVKLAKEEKAISADAAAANTDKDDGNDDATDEGGKGTRVLVELTEPWHDTGRVFTANAYFASVEAALKMKDKGLLFIGNVKQCSKMLPTEVLSNTTLVSSRDGKKLS
jgi:hypothetical protein